MAEYWVSQAKHYCKVCKIWISGHKRNIDIHEGSIRHKENLAVLLKEKAKAAKEKDKEDKEAKKIIADMERAADEAMGYNMAKWTGGTAAAGSSSGAAGRVRKAKSENDF